MKIKSLMKMIVSACFMLALSCAVPGCDREEEVIDIETPAGEIEVDRDRDSGEVDVEATSEDDRNDW